MYMYVHMCIIILFKYGRNLKMSLFFLFIIIKYYKLSNNFNDMKKNTYMLLRKKSETVINFAPTLLRLQILMLVTTRIRKSSLKKN